MVGNIETMDMLEQKDYSHCLGEVVQAVPRMVIWAILEIVPLFLLTTYS